jgi:hypothetical protein
MAAMAQELGKLRQAERDQLAVVDGFLIRLGWLRDTAIANGVV